MQAYDSCDDVEGLVGEDWLRHRLAPLLQLWGLWRSLQCRPEELERILEGREAPHPLCCIDCPCCQRPAGPPASDEGSALDTSPLHQRAVAFFEDGMKFFISGRLQGGARSTCTCVGRQCRASGGRAGIAEHRAHFAATAQGLLQSFVEGAHHIHAVYFDCIMKWYTFRR